MPIDIATFKSALGSWPSGVTIVTSRHSEIQHGMTVSAFSAVSAEPPQVLVCTNRQSTTHAVIERSGCFTVSILSAGQEEIANLFADKSREETRFEGLACTPGATGCPRIPGALVHLDCRVIEAVTGGTHMIYVGLVEAAAVHDSAPMAFYRGRYCRLS
jgi:flavin reductase (DIM6/NTAB) family NADH-FMN oxidoreductase RutF